MIFLAGDINHSHLSFIFGLSRSYFLAEVLFITADQRSGMPLPPENRWLHKNDNSRRFSSSNVDSSTLSIEFSH